MVRIPLEKRLRKRAQVETAMLQDEVLEVLYSIDNQLVLHGGTAIWRCYGGNRFSEDIDAYSQSPKLIEEKLPAVLASHGIDLKKMKNTGQLLFCKASSGTVEVRMEINLVSKVSPVLKPYEKVDGTTMDVLTLSAEELLIEKLEAYKARRFVRDIYDVNHLGGLLEKPEKVKRQVGAFLKSAGRPVDEDNLQAIVYSGAVPTLDSIMSSLKRRFS